MNNNNDQIREMQELADILKKSLDDVSKQIENLGKATDYFGKILGDSVKGFNPS